eukprot:CAMPEP_0170188626 /NCGR_PEP_ID=MMETSP0040_2-20121228/44816_1 /TAXON_ID=641309 /ORGANISM="Lotharella oceanica, Strain CCMP622" /LENGTH=112 /DNA_ID=CAMNT_0010435963 /DNA_START=190 /DNA_END=528 /DNA_ORIENTATION=-
MPTPGPAVLAAICLSAPCSLMTYVLGFVATYRVSDGIVRYIVLLILQVLGIPLFGMMEVLGVAWAILAPPGDGFYIVQKESEVDGRKDRKNATKSEVQCLLNKGKATHVKDV